MQVEHPSKIDNTWTTDRRFPKEGPRDLSHRRGRLDPAERLDVGRGPSLPRTGTTGPKNDDKEVMAGSDWCHQEIRRMEEAGHGGRENPGPRQEEIKRKTKAGHSRGVRNVPRALNPY